MKTTMTAKELAAAALAALCLAPAALRADAARALGVLDPGAATAYVPDGAAVASAQTFNRISSLLVHILSA